MDELGITQRGVDEDGKRYYPAALFDGHISWMGEDFLCYVNDDDTLWMPMLGAPYGTGIWQYHNDKRKMGNSKQN